MEFLVISIAWSLISCVWAQINLISLEKGFCNITTKFMIFVWGAFAILRRILSIIALFIPSMGLFSILHHWRWEQIPFSTRLEYAKRPENVISSEDKISLYGLNETIYWTELDHWDYSMPQDPTPPPYSLYTLFSLQTTFIAGAALLAVQFLIITVIKILTSTEFRRKDHYVNKFIHVLLNLNYAIPYADWDMGNHTIQEFRARFKATCKEMAATLSVNILITLMMLVPLWYTGQKRHLMPHMFSILSIFSYIHRHILFLAYQVQKRHKFLERLITVKDEEVVSYENMHNCLVNVTVSVFVFSVMEVASYFSYLNFVSIVRN